jgi:hypothetical protein
MKKIIIWAQTTLSVVWACVTWHRCSCGLRGGHGSCSDVQGDEWGVDVGVAVFWVVVGVVDQDHRC